jgi:saccharopine dehydrogenase (NAD+, L-lysine-forming)
VDSRLTVQAFEKIKFGSDVYALRIDATGSVAGVRSTRTGAVTGRCEADATAAVAAAIARRTLEHPLPAGVFHSEQLFELEELLPEIETQISFISGSGLQDDRSP